MAVLDLEEMAQGKTIPNLLWRSVAGFSDILTTEFDQLALRFLELGRHFPVSGILN